MPDARRRTPLVFGWGVSLALHALVVGAGFALVWSIQREDDEPYATDARTVVFHDPGLAPEPVTADASPAEPAQRDDALDTLFEPNPAERPVLVTETPVDPPTFEPERPAEPVEQRTIAEPTLVNDAEFFGTGASDARKIVYVVDASGSSIALFPAIARELERSLLDLNATQHATVIAAKGRLASADAEARGVVERPPTTGLVRATTSKARALADWFAADVSPGGRSDLLLAFREAMALEPDAIFLIAIPPNASAREPGFLGALDRLNPIDARTGRRLAIIGVVCVGAPAFDDPLNELSRAHNDGAEPTILDRNALLQTR